MRMSDLAGTYASVDTLALTSAARAPLESDRSVPIPSTQREQHGHRHRRHRHRGREHCGGGVAADDEPPRTHAVDDAREEAAAEHEREEAEREAQRCEKRRAGAAVDEDRQRHGGDARPADRDELAHEERAELPRPERRPVADAHVVFAAHADRVGEARRRAASDSRLRVSSSR